MEVVKVKASERSYMHPEKHAENTLRRHSNPESETITASHRHSPPLFDRDGDGWFLTEEGQLYVEDSMGSLLAYTEGSGESSMDYDRFVEWTTFHQSYSYEDFVEGLRPVVSDDGEISYEVVPGVFRRICKRAELDPDNDYTIVIDEINRGNISKIFGELMTLLEDDKRADEENELSVTLPYSGHSFSVPSNLSVIATMNTADRSIALLDVALRRRFAFIEVTPDASLLEGTVVESEDQSVDLGALLEALNRAIARDIDRDHQIGHSYLMSVANASEGDRSAELDFVWNNRILPLLEEYYYAYPEGLAELLKWFVVDDEAEIDEEEVDITIARAEGQNLLVALGRLVDG